MKIQTIRMRGFWCRAGCLLATFLSWGFVLFSFLHEVPADIVYAIEPLTASLLGSLGFTALNIGSQFLKKKPSPTTTTPTTPDFSQVASQLRTLEGGLGGRPDLGRFLESPEARTLSESLARIKSKPVIRRAGRARAQREETARRIGTLRTGGFTRGERQSDQDLQDVFADIGDRSTQQLLDVFQQTQLQPFQQRMANLLGLASGGRGTTTSAPADNRLSAAVGAGAEGVGDFTAMLILQELLKKGGGGGKSPSLFPPLPPTG